MSTTQLFTFTLRLADNALILAQRNSEWTAHGPVLEQDIAITNISLDLFGQARNFYQHAAALYNNFTGEEKITVDKFIPQLWKAYNRELQEDDLAFLRDEDQYLNLLITELPKGDWAFTVLRQFLFSAFQFYEYTTLKKNADVQLAAIAEKSLKEIVYHLRWSGEWVIRLGDGTEHSNQRIKHAINDLWIYTEEMFAPGGFELIDNASLKIDWMKKVEEVFDEATLANNSEEILVKSTSPLYIADGEELRVRRHTEYFAELVADMQYMQRTYPNSVW